MTDKKNKEKRPDWDDYFLNIREAVSERATCDRGKTGVVVVKNKRILATGYVGSPPGAPHCDEAGHVLRKVIYEDGNTREHCVRTLHAESNAICFAARFGVKLEGATMYCKMEPCDTCANMIAASGIKRVVCEKSYHGAIRTREIFKYAGITLDVKDDTIEEYERQKV